MNKVSISILYNQKLEIKSSILYKDNKIEDITEEFKYSNKIKEIIDSCETIKVFDIKYFLKYINSKIQIDENSIKKIDSIKLILNIFENKKNISILEIANRQDFADYYNRLETFKKIYGDKYLDFVPNYILRNYCISECKILDSYKNIHNLNEKYYNDIKLWINELVNCELNGIKSNDKLYSINNIIYPIYNYDKVSTGRLINTYPINFQSLDSNNKIKESFISRFKDGKFLIADYNSLDLRVAFSISKENIIVNDLHTYISNILLDKNDVTEEERKKIKEINFGIIYGAGLKLLSEKTNYTIEDTKKLLNKFFNKFKNLRNFIIYNNDFIIKNGFAISFFGRKRFLNSNEKNKFLNSTIQMTSSDICYRAIYNIQNLLTKSKLESKLIPYIIYDKFVIDCKNEEIEKIKSIVEKSMSILAPGELSDYVNFPINIEITEKIK